MLVLDLGLFANLLQVQAVYFARFFVGLSLVVLLL